MSEGMNDGRLREGRKSDGMEGREEGNATGGNEVGEWNGGINVRGREWRVEEWAGGNGMKEREDGPEMLLGIALP